MKAHLIDTHPLGPRSRSSAKVKVKYQGHVSEKMGVSGALVFHKHISFTLSVQISILLDCGQTQNGQNRHTHTHPILGAIGHRCSNGVSIVMKFVLPGFCCSDGLKKSNVPLQSKRHLQMINLDIKKISMATFLDRVENTEIRNHFLDSIFPLFFPIMFFKGFLCFL